MSEIKNEPAYVNLYFPLVDKQPGNFDGNQICYADKFHPVRPVKSVSTIRSQILKSIQYRIKNDFAVDRDDYNYQRIVIDLSMLSVREKVNHE